MKTFTIKGLYLNFKERKNPTYFGTLNDCINYVNTNQDNFIHFEDDDIKICVGNCVYAILKCVKKCDSAGEYFEFEDWKIIRK